MPESLKEKHSLDLMKSANEATKAEDNQLHETEAEIDDCGSATEGFKALKDIASCLDVLWRDRSIDEALDKG